MKRLLVLAMAGMMLATGCNSADGRSVQGLRAAAGIVATPQDSPPTQPPPTETPAQIPTAPPQPTETPDIEPQAFAQSAQPAQVIEVTRVVLQEIPATPEPAQLVAAIDESVQPCPARFWKRGRCTATQAQLDAYAQGATQP